jgi:ketosteroid isomerase-like protein
MPDESTAPDLAQALRRLTEAANRRPLDLDEALAMYSHDAVVDNGPVGAGLFEGREAIRGFFEDWATLYEDFEQVLEEVRHLGHGVTFALILLRGRLVGSSAPIELRYAGVSTWTDGLIERVTTYTDIDEARVAAERLAEERA